MTKTEQKHFDAILHVRGESQYVDDVAAPAGMLHAVPYGSPIAHGKDFVLDLDEARAQPGVVAILTAADIPGENQIGPVVEDEQMLADGVVRYQGQPVALVVAESVEQAMAAREKIRMDAEALPAITDPREAYEKGELIAPPRTFEMGDVEGAWAQCAVIVEGRCDVAGQEHLYLETQRARAMYEEGGRLRVVSSTQSPYAVQKAIARVLGRPNHTVEVDVPRLGGGFGGKEDQATVWACLAALAANHLGCAVELVLNRVDDLRMTGKRHPYSADYKMGLSEDGRILAYEVRHFQNAGAVCDLSLSVLERTLFHSTNTYFVPNVRAMAASCRTNLPPNTAFRGFGGPQGMYAIECALADAAERLGMTREELQYRNLLEEGDLFSYGQKAENAQAMRTWNEAFEAFDWATMRREVDAFNAENTRLKRGLAAMPVCFGISFTTTFLNQASALVHVYTDGSVSLSTGGVEMGQGLNTKLMNMAAKTLGIRDTRVRVESTNTTRIANMSPSAASATADLNGGATILACSEIVGRLRTLLGQKLGVHDPENITIEDEQVLYRGEPTDWTWERLVMDAYLARVALSSHAFYATPNIWFDKGTEKGRPFAYHAYGTAIVQTTIDTLRGTYTVDTVRIVHDLGRPVNELVDIGQIEGGLAQGLGWMTLEELAYNHDGRLLSQALSTYKPPDAYFMPDDLQVRLLEGAHNPAGPYGSKAVGEPPLMYGIAAYFALRDAIRAHRAATGTEGAIAFDAPMTPERVLLNLYPGRVDALLSGTSAGEKTTSAAPAPAGE